MPEPASVAAATQYTVFTLATCVLHQPAADHHIPYFSLCFSLQLFAESPDWLRLLQELNLACPCRVVMSLCLGGVFAFVAAMARRRRHEGVRIWNLELAPYFTSLLACTHTIFVFGIHPTWSFTY